MGWPSRQSFTTPSCGSVINVLLWPCAFSQIMATLFKRKIHHVPWIDHRDYSDSPVKNLITTFYGPRGTDLHKKQRYEITLAADPKVEKFLRMQKRCTKWFYASTKLVHSLFIFCLRWQPNVASSCQHSQPILLDVCGCSVSSRPLRNWSRNFLGFGPAWPDVVFLKTAQFLRKWTKRCQKDDDLGDSGN